MPVSARPRAVPQMPQMPMVNFDDVSLNSSVNSLSNSHYRREESGGGSSAVAIPKIALEPNEASAKELRALSGRLVEASTDREGSKMVQTLLDSVTSADRHLVFEELLPHSIPLMQHVFGNYVMQRLLHYGTHEELSVLHSLISSNILELSHNTFGCRVVQKALEVFPKMDGIALGNLLQTHVKNLAADQHGNHVLQRCLETCGDAALFIATELQGHISATSCQKYGCRVVQRLVSSVSEGNNVNLSILGCVVDEVVSNLHALARDQFGNYVVQAVMRCQQAVGLKPVYLLRGSFAILSRHKHASNVVETAFAVANPSLRNALLTEVLPHASQVAGDQFGNFVIQRIFDQCDTKQQAMVADSLKSSAHILRNHIYGRSVISALQRNGALTNIGEAPSQAARPHLKNQIPQSLYALSESGSFSSQPATPITPATTTSSGDWMSLPQPTFQQALEQQQQQQQQQQQLQMIHQQQQQQQQQQQHQPPQQTTQHYQSSVDDDDDDDASALYEASCYAY